MNIHVIHEICGGSVLIAFTDEQDAKSWLHWEEAMGRLRQGDYTVKEIRLENLQ